jgi:predicted nucleic-acid-binding protein
MIALDTNILVRYIVQDDPQQSAQVSEFLRRYAHKQDSLFINNIVLCELVWVLTRLYQYSSEDITKVLYQIFTTEEFSFENRGVLMTSLVDCMESDQDFSDILIGKINHLEYGCKATVTFDKRASSLKEFELLEKKPVVSV